MDTAKLVRMANQVAQNQRLKPHDEAVRDTAAHLRSFWTPTMREQLLAHATRGAPDLDPIAREAALALRA
jgi:formate dehydrogenase subunit delta